MSGITPILDTLLHQVLGKRVDIPVVKDQPGPVSPATSSDAIQPARSDSRLHQQSGDRVAAASATAGREARSASTNVPSQAGTASTQLHLSQAATRIADILARFPSTQTASIRPLVALLPPGADADTLAAALSQSVRDSGVFYESHLNRWLSGQYPLQALMREPQAWLGLQFRPLAPGSNFSLLLSPAFPSVGGVHRDTPTRHPAARMATRRDNAAAAGGALSTVASATEKHVAFREAIPALLTRTPSPRADAVSSSSTLGHPSSPLASESLQALVRHQLELIVSPNLRWEGQLWPGVPMALSLFELSREQPADDDVEESPHRASRAAGDGGDEWRADVRILLPSLGAIDLVFQARRDGPLRVDIDPEEELTRRRIEPKLALLHERLTRAGVVAAVAVGSASRGDSGDE